MTRSAYAMQRDQRNKDLRRQRMAAARAKGTHTTDEWNRLKGALGNLCVRCRGVGGPLQKDHIVPVYRGGSDGIENLQPLCPRCNAAKGPESVDHRDQSRLWWVK